MFRVRVQHILLIIVWALCGCGTQADRWKDARPETTPVSGEVTYDGKPLAGAVVVFHPTSPGGIGASGLTNDKGEFQLQTFPPDLGAVPGTYQVSVMKTEMPQPSTQAVSTDDPDPVHVISVIPAKYGVPTQSGLTAEIPEGGTETLLFDLKK